MVTGAAGFIGKHLIKELINKGMDVVAFDRKYEIFKTEFIKGNLTNFNFDKILGDIDVIFHLAGLLGTTELFHKVIEAEKVNVLGTLNLLESMRRKDVNKIVFTSKPNIWKYNVYTISKENCERYLEMYKEIYGFETVITRPFNVYGPDEPLDEYRKAVPYFIVKALKDENIEIFGDGTQTLDPIYVEDVITALIKCSEKLPEEVVEIGTSASISVNGIAERIINLCQSNSEIVHKPMRRGEPDNSYISANGNIERLLEFKPKINLNVGLKRTIEWYKNHLDEFNNIYKFKEEDFWQ